MAFPSSNSSLIRSNLLFRLSIHNTHLYFLLALIGISLFSAHLVSATGDPSEGECKWKQFVGNHFGGYFGAK